MSGGSYDYFHSNIETFAGEVEARAGSPLRKAFVAHLLKVAKAARAIEWVDSGDWGRGDEDEPIRACLPEGAEMQAAIVDAERARDALQAVLDRASANA